MFCPNCGKEIQSPSNFCPFCGKQLQEVDKPLTSTEKIKIYLTSFFLAPLGLWWVFKFIRSKDKQKKQTAIIALILTVVSISLSAWVIYGYIQSVNKYINSSSLDQYKGLGL